MIWWRKDVKSRGNANYVKAQCSGNTPLSDFTDLELLKLTYIFIFPAVVIMICVFLSPGPKPGFDH